MKSRAVQRQSEEKRRKKSKKNQKKGKNSEKEDPGARKGREVAKHCVFPNEVWLRRVEK